MHAYIYNLALPTLITIITLMTHIHRYTQALIQATEARLPPLKTHTIKSVVAAAKSGISVSDLSSSSLLSPEGEKVMDTDVYTDPEAKQQRSKSVYELPDNLEKKERQEKKHISAPDNTEPTYTNSTSGEIIKNDQKTLTGDTGDHGESGGSASSKKNGENDEKEASNAASSPVGGSDLTDETVDSHQPSLSQQGEHPEDNTLSGNTAITDAKAVVSEGSEGSVGGAEVGPSEQPLAGGERSEKQSSEEQHTDIPVSLEGEEKREEGKVSSDAEAVEETKKRGKGEDEEGKETEDKPHLENLFMTLEQDESEYGFDHVGQCGCGGVAFKVQGELLFNALCHCRGCTRSRGAPGVHLLGVSPATALTVTRGQHLLKTHTTSSGGLSRVFCSACGCGIHQGPLSAPFVSVFASTLAIKQRPSFTPGLGDFVLPSELLPQVHINYESRYFDVHDDLPKFKGFPQDNIQLLNDGTYSDPADKLAAEKAKQEAEAAALAIRPAFDQTGACACGAVEYQVQGDVIFNAVCHCQGCTHSRGAPGVHVIGVTPTSGLVITKGEEFLKTHGSVPGGPRRTFCRKCGCGVLQAPEG